MWHHQFSYISSKQIFVDLFFFSKIECKIVQGELQGSGRKYRNVFDKTKHKKLETIAIFHFGWELAVCKPCVQAMCYPFHSDFM